MNFITKIRKQLITLTVVLVISNFILLIPAALAAVDIQHLFNVEIPTSFAKHKDAANQIGAKFQFNVTGDGGGEWFIDASPTGPLVKTGNPGNADVTITLASEDFQKLYENPQANGMQLFFAGKMKMAGNPMLAQKLWKVFALGGN